MTDRLVFHESFDSTRATFSSRPHDLNITQAHIESVISLLLGRSLALNNTYAFDSRSFLDFADVMLDTRQRALVRHPAAGDDLKSQMPFSLFRFRQPSYLTGCADQLQRHNPDPDKHFRLSGWGQITDLPTERDLLAEQLKRIQAHKESGGGATYDAPLPTELKAQFPGLERQYDLLLRIDSYFDHTGFSHDAVNPKTSLPAYVRTLVDLDDPTVDEMAQIADCPPDLARRVRDRLREQQTRKNAFTARTWAHDFEAVAVVHSGDVTTDELVREFIDTAYNATLAESATAQFKYMSSVPRHDGRDDLKYMNAFTLGIIRATREPASIPEQIKAERVTQRMTGLLTAGSKLPGPTTAGLDRVLTEYWNLLADPDRRVSWQQSTDLMHNQLGREVVDALAFRDAWQAHIARLTRQLPRIVSGGDGELAVTMSNGETEYHQTHQLGEATRTDLDSALAAGEHLEALGTITEELNDEK